MKPTGILLLALLHASSIAAEPADLLKIDFDHSSSPTETGFIGQNSSGVPHSTTAGNALDTTAAIADDTSLTVAAPSSTTLISVDFGSAGAEPGFTEQSSTTTTHSTSAGDLTVDLSGVQGLFNFATTGANDLLYRDFYFKNGGTITLTLSGVAISPGTDYELGFWSYYGAGGRNTTFAPGTGTTGPSLGPIASSTTPPTGLADPLYFVPGTYTSDASGNLTILVSGTNSRPAINGLRIATIGPDTTPPSILPANIIDNQGGADVEENTLVTYSLTFSEDIDDTSVSSADFSNAGTSPVTFGSITETTAGVFTVEVTPTAAGTLQLQIPTGATILDMAGLGMDTTAATLDDTTLNVVVAPPDNTAPTPNPMTFAVVPYASSETSIAMEASTATDDAGVEYYFDETSGNAGGNDSGWQNSPIYKDTGLTTGLSYTYTVIARDLSSNQNATASSDPESATAQTPIVPPTITAPTSRHIVQRTTANVGTIEVEGSYSVGTPDEIEARAVVMAGAGNNGTTTPWQTIDASPSGGTFAESLINVSAGGWYQLEVRSVISSTPSNAAVLEKVGVGDIYVTAGQSNSANFAANEAPQDDRISARTSTTASTWTLATAPLPISNGGGGNVWTWLANRLIAAEDVPIGLVSCGIGGSVASSWTIGGGNYNSLLKPAVKSFPVNGFKAALWHQGETDSIGGVPATTHSGYLTGMITGSRSEAGWNIPWYLAEVSFHGSSNLTKQEPVAAGQRLAIHSNPLTFFGPSTDELHLTGGGSLHFNAIGTDEHARQWADILLGTVSFGPINGDFETHGWIQYAAPNDTSATPLDDGASTILDTVSTGQQHRVLNWRILSSSGETAADGANGFHNPTTGTYAGAVDSVNGGVLANMSGKHVALLDGGSAGNYFLQSTRALAVSNTTYTLTVALGVRDDPASFGNARLEITANGAVVTSAVFNKAALDSLRGSDSSGTFTDATISWTSGASVPANQPLAVRIVKEGGEGTVLDFDNVRFTSQAIPDNDFSSWIDGFGLDPADKGFDADPDGDGLKNGVEAWFGTNPSATSQGISEISRNGLEVSFTHPLNPAPPVDLSGSYEWSRNLTDWYAGDGIAGPEGGPTVSIAATPSGSLTTVVATMSEIMERIFLRARVDPE